MDGRGAGADRDSRVDGTRLLAETVSRSISAGAAPAPAVGYYGQRGDEELTEESAAGEVPRRRRPGVGGGSPTGPAAGRGPSISQGIVLAKDGAAKRMLLLSAWVSAAESERVAVVEPISLDDVARTYLRASRRIREGRLQPRRPWCGPNHDSDDALGAALHRPRPPAPGLRREARVCEMGERCSQRPARCRRASQTRLPSRPGARGRAEHGLSMTWWALLLLGGRCGTSALMLYVVRRGTGSATVVDAGWAASPRRIAILYAALGGGEREHRALVGITGGLAFGRPTRAPSRSGSTARRTCSIRRSGVAGASAATSSSAFLVFFQTQALAAVLLSVPLLAGATTTTMGSSGSNGRGSPSGSSGHPSKWSPTGN